MGAADDPADRPGVIAPPALIFGAAMLAGLLLERVRPLTPLPVPLSVALGAPLVGIGCSLAAWAIRTMRRAGTNVDPRKPATALVVTGPFRFSRNPVYLSLTLVYLGVTAWADALWPLVLLLPALAVLQRGVVAREERYLERKFGDAYRRYKATVRRWL